SPCSRVAYPQFNAGRGCVAEGKMLAIIRPGGNAQLCTRRCGQLLLFASSNLPQRQAYDAWREMRAVRVWIQAKAGNAKHWLREIGNGRVARRLYEEEAIPRRTDGSDWW